MVDSSRFSYMYIPDSWDQREFLLSGGFTVVFLNYNKRTSIEKSVASALAQDYSCVEMVFMDDASTDGSGDLMERLVRRYRGRHKVCVVRNAENQNITGQWNLVAGLATGNWFGMFCADDIARENRVSCAARIVQQNPTLKGFCTSGVEFDSRSGVVHGKMCAQTPTKVVPGRIDLRNKIEYDTPVIGATSFWHRDVFVNPIPFSRCDDIELRWILQFLYRDQKSPVWMWCAEIDSIEYAVGGGVTNSFNEMDRPFGIRASLTSDMRRQRNLARVLMTSWQAVCQYYEIQSAPRNYCRFAVSKVIEYKWVASGTFGRILHLSLLVTYFRCAGLCKCVRLAIMFFKQFFGLECAGMLGAVVHAIRDGNKERKM